MTTTHRFSDRVAEIVEPEIAKYGDSFSWDYSVSIVPTPQGPQPLCVFSVLMKNPLIGTGDMANMDLFPEMALLTDQQAVAEMVANAVRSLRERHAQTLDVSAINV